ncbi:hypothetical protein Tco_0159122 [Tanacetum coccineum]
MITSSNPRNQATVQDGRVVVQNVQGRQNRGQGNNARGAGAVGYGGAQNRVGNANPGQARQSLDEEQLLFIAGGTADVVCLRSDVVMRAPTAQLCSWKVISSAENPDAICEHHEEHGMQDDVQPNYVVASHADYMSDSNMTPYDRYVKDNAMPVVQNNASTVPNDIYVMIDNDLHEPKAQSVFKAPTKLVVIILFNAELAIYKNKLKCMKERARFKVNRKRTKD